jgi:chemotaxis protein CheX
MSNGSLQSRDVIKIIQEVFSSMLALEISPLDAVASAAPNERKLSASVGIAGEWNGTVTLQCGADTACRLAGAMLAMDPAPDVDEDVKDVLGELANIVAGNIKSMLPGPSSLSLPCVIDGSNYSLEILHGEELINQPLLCHGNGLIVSIVQAKPTAAARKLPGVSAA